MRRAMLAPKVYRELVNTYQNDQASKAKIRGRVQQLGVHPDLSEKCADLFVASAVTARLAIVEGDGIRLVVATDAVEPKKLEAEVPEGDTLQAGERRGVDSATVVQNQEEHANATLPQTSNQVDASKLPAPRPRMAADVAVNLTVDSSLDGDKLERQLALLRRYGLI